MVRGCCARLRVVMCVAAVAAVAAGAAAQTVVSVGMPAGAGTPLLLAEGGAAALFEVSVASEPADTVVVRVQCSGGVLVSPSTVVMSPQRWGPTSVAVYPLDDAHAAADAQDVVVTFSVTSGGATFASTGTGELNVDGKREQGEQGGGWPVSSPVSPRALWMCACCRCVRVQRLWWMTTSLDWLQSNRRTFWRKRQRLQWLWRCQASRSRTTWCPCW